MSFPHDDKAWATTAEFLRGRLAATDRLVAPDPFRWVIPRAQRFVQARGQQPKGFEWVVVHKGELGQIPRPFLAALPTAAVPVFANEVFVVFATAPAADLADLSDTDHVRAFHANADALPPEAPLPAPVGAWSRPEGVTGIRLPGATPMIRAPRPAPGSPPAASRASRANAPSRRSWTA